MSSRKFCKMLSTLLAGTILLTNGYIPVMAENPVTFEDSASKKTQSADTGSTAESGSTKKAQETQSGGLEAQMLTADEGDVGIQTLSETAESAVISSFDDTFDKKKYPLDRAPEKDVLASELPSSLTVTVSGGGQENIAVSSWESDDYNASVPGDYTFTPVLSDSYDYSTAPSVPWIEVCVTKNVISDIQTVFEDRSYVLAKAPSAEEIEKSLPDTLTATVNEEDQDVQILSWNTDYDISRAGIYTFTPVLDDDVYSYDESTIPSAVITLTAAPKRAMMQAAAVEGKVTSIGTFVAQVSGGATKRSNGDYVWKAITDTSGHQFAFRVNYSTSGQGTLPGNVDGSESAIKITIPKTILKNRSGDRSDYYEMSLPERDEVPTLSKEELRDTTGFAYYEDGDNIIVYNFEPLDAAQNGYFEVAYATRERTFNYKDYGSTDSASSPFQATITVSGLTKTTDPLKVYIDTTATINTTYKKYPTQAATTWRSGWGQKPSDADDYVWQRWEIRSDITDDPTQFYDFILTDEVTCSEVPVEVYGYQFSGSDQITKNNRVSNISSYDGYRYDYVYTRIKRSDWNNVTSYNIHNKITATVHPVDGVDEDTNAVATRDFAWTRPVFVHPTGHFYTWKYGNENWTSLFGYDDIDEWDYASYDLDRFQESKSSSIDDIKYAIWAYGYPFPWTLRDGGSSDNPYDYGYKDVTYQVTDEAFYNLNMDGTYGDSKQKFAPDYTNGWETEKAPGEDGEPLTPRMDPEDYDISYISLSAYFNDVPRDANGHLSEEAGSLDEDLHFNNQYISPTDKDVLTFWTKTGTGNYVKAGELNLGTGKSSVVSGGLISSITADDYKFQYRGNYRVTFKDGVDGFRVTTSNNHYYTDIKMYPYISIKNSARMLAWTGTGRITAEGSTSKDAVLVRNVSNLQVFDSKGNQILDLTKAAGDRLRRAEKASEISKKVTGASNNQRKKYCTVSWKVNANETFTTGTGSAADTSFITQSSGTFYDLLPAGAVLQDGSVAVATPSGTQTPSAYKMGGREDYLADNAFTVKTIENYRNSGRTMLIVQIKDPGACYSVYYTTIHSWDSIVDYGKLVTNPVAYETGNEEIAGGFPDDPNAKNIDNLTIDEVQNGRSYAQFSAEHRALYKDIDPDTDEYKFIYDEEKHDIIAITAASAGLNKRVKSVSDSGWEYDTTVHPDETYTYRLRFANTFTSAAKDLILYDSIENYYKTDGAEKGESAWYGKLTHIDTTQMEKVKSYDPASGEDKDVTLKPVVYVSMTAGLDLDVAANRNLSSTSVWTKLTSSTDLSKVKAVAYDLRKDSAGNDFILKPGGSVSSMLYMESPHTITGAAAKQYPETYNNVYLYDTVIGTDGSLTPYDIHYDYTTVRYAVTANFGLHKVSAKDPTQSIRDIQFRLFGTSDYGTEVDKIVATDKNGDISFKNIEKGTYVLQEYSGTPDWLEDHTEHKVVIDGNAKVTIDGTDYTDKQITIQNSPRIHADIEFLKREDGRPSIPVPGAMFMLSGTSDYGNDILMYAKSENGRVLFENVERGKYTLQETKAPDGYVVSPKKYEATVDENGVVLIKDLTANKQGLYTILNEKLHKFNIIKRSSYDNSPISGAEFHLTGISDYGTKVDMTATSGANGFAGFEGLEAGTYLLQETKTDDKHKLDETKRVVRIDSNNTITISGLNQSETDKTSFIWINTRIPNEEVTVVKEWVGGAPEFTESNMPVIHLVADGNPDYTPQTAYFSKDANQILKDANPLTFSRNTSLTEDQVKQKAGVKRLDSTADDESSYQRIYGWMDDARNYYWWSNTETASITDESHSLFSGMADITRIDLTGIDATHASNLSALFCQDASLIDVNAELLDVSHATDMNNMFQGCNALQSLDLSSWDVSNVTNFYCMFYYTTGLQSLNITGWDMSSVKAGKNSKGEYADGYSVNAEAFYRLGDQTNGIHIIANNMKFPETCYRMFAESSVTNIELNQSDLSSVIDMSYCFYECQKLKEISITNSTDAKKIRFMNYAFANCDSLTTASLSGFSTSENLLNAAYMFKEDSKMQTVQQDLNTKSAYRLDNMFVSCSSLAELDLSNFDTSSIGVPNNGYRTNGLSALVSNCSSLKKLNISGWNLSKTSGGYCNSLGTTYAPELTLIANNLKLPEYCQGLFNDLDPVYVEMNNIDFSDVTYLGSLFNSYDNGARIKELTINGFGADKIQQMNMTFYGKSSLTNLDLSWLESSPVYTYGLFANCSSLKNIYVSDKCDFSKSTDSTLMFDKCTSLPHFDSTKVDKTNANTSSTGYLTLKK